MYRIFSARWWADAACTRPIEGPRHKVEVKRVHSEEEARAICRAHNWRAGERVQRPYGSAYEYEKC